ncbi:MAG: SAM-dependent methyltransferase [Pelagibacteraceae bacterium]|nr:SAM-dependent methyltransferase [Pelagibacteraceae bacterium]|tara:strand:+ start:27289 stop:28461 length:1173 start_codon:yes stop_codon:yes gene_type:complete
MLNYNKFIIDKIINNINYGSLSIIYPDDEKFIYKGTIDGPNADIKLYNFKIISNLLFKGNIGLGESYINNHFETSNLSNLIEFIVVNQNSFKKISNGNFIYRLFQKINHLRNHNSKINSINNIKYHYDLGNNFYSQWLDETMSYSSALFDDFNIDLKNAQLNKYNRLLSLINPSDKSKILEIGCGWGSLANHIAKYTNAHVTAVTISQKQYAHVSNLIQQNGLNENVTVELKDYRDINKKFDSIVSIEMFEAVGEKYWPVFFNKLKDNLEYGGKSLLQVITINENLFENYRNRPDFIQKYIFPGGMLPSKEIFRSFLYNEGLLIRDEFNFALSYAKTLNEWNKRFQKSWPQISKQGFNDYFKRMWEYYLAYCEGGFKGGSIDISQYLITK